MSEFERILEYGTTIEYRIVIPDGNHVDLSRVIDELRRRGLPRDARVQATLGGARPTDMRIDVAWDAMPEPRDE